MLIADKRTEVFGKDNPFLAKLTQKKTLTSPRSAKETVHLVVNIAGSDMSYEPGDSLGVYPTNDLQTVNALIKTLGFQGDESVLPKKFENPISLQEALSHHLSLAGPTKNFLKWLLERITNGSEKAKLGALLEQEDPKIVKDYLYNREFIDLAEEFASAQFTAQEYIENLKRLLPRLYSIASSPRQYPNEIHLTVAVVRYNTNNKGRVGVASTYLSDRADFDQSNLPVFVSKSRFKLPTELYANVIMVGPGTGVAPFRAFMQDHVALGRSGKMWLLFGERTRKHEYLYREEWENYLTNGDLSVLDLAFSRDQAEKIYVQHKMAEKSEELWKWIDSGSYFYVCGDAECMAKDVEAQLLEIFQKHGKMSEEAAKMYLKRIKKEKRYQKDVY